MNKAIPIMCYFHSDTTAQLEDAGLEDKINDEDYEQRLVYFYNIGAVCRRIDGGLNIYLGDTVFRSPMSIKEVLGLIETNNK